jgi:hypothetical protein
MWVHPSQGWSEEGGLMLMASLPALNRAAHRVQRSPDDIDKESQPSTSLTPRLLLLIQSTSLWHKSS